MTDQTTTEQPGYTFWECRDCGFDCVTLDAAMRNLPVPICPLCAGDSGHEVVMRSRVARADDKPEGRDARKDGPARTEPAKS